MTMTTAINDGQKTSDEPVVKGIEQSEKMKPRKNDKHVMNK